MFSSRTRRPWLSAVLGATLSFSSSAAAQPRVNPEALALKEFGDRVEDYVKLHRRLEDRLPKLSSTATLDQVLAHRRALAAAIRRARPTAKPGDVFIDAVRPQLRRIISADFAKRGPADAAAALEEVPRTVRLEANGDFPEDSVRATVPPAILSQLPRLPGELSYRFAGRALVLFDVHANLIVDFVTNVLPGP